MTYEDITGKVASDTGLSKRLVDRIYRAYWKVVREHIASLPLKDDLTDEEFMQLQPNVNIPSLGKLNVTLDRYHRMKKMFNIRKEIRNVENQEDKAPVHISADNRGQV